MIGHVTDDGNLTIKENGRLIAQLPAETLDSGGAPTYIRETREPEYFRDLNQLDISTIQEPEDYGGVLKRLLASTNICSKEWIYRQFDTDIGGNTVVKPGSDAAVLRVQGTSNQSPSPPIATTIMSFQSQGG